MLNGIKHVVHLLKSQLNLFDYRAPAHEEVHHREGTTRHTANGGTVQVAATMAKVTVRGKEGDRLQHGHKVYYKVPGQPRKKKGTIVAGSHEEGYTIQPVRDGYTFRPAQITTDRDNVWTDEEHKAETARTGTRETTSRGGSTISTEESRRRAEVGQQRAQLDEGKVLTHPVFVSRMKSTLAHLATSNGFNPHYIDLGGALHNDDNDANELYSEYIAAAMNSYRTETSRAPEKDLDDLRDTLAGEGSDSRILMSMTRAGKTAALRHIIAHQRHLQEHTSYDGGMEDDQESGMRGIAAQAATVPEHESDAAKKAQLMQGIVTHLESLDDPIAAAIIKMKFGLDRFDHAYKDQDIAAALNRANMPAPEGERWDADQVKVRMTSALANLARTRGMQDLRGLLKSMQELGDLRKAVAEHQRTACIDFDGPLADYSQGFLGVDKFGPPVDGAAEGMHELKDAGWKLIIHTTRPDTPVLRAYLADNGIPFDEINTNSEQPEGANPGKPIADIYLDDRAVRFTSWGKALVDVNSLHKSVHLYAPSPIDGLMERFHLIKSHIQQYARQDGTVVQEHNDRRVRKHQDVIAHENKHGEQVHQGSTLKHGEDLMTHLRGNGWKEKETHPVKKDERKAVGKKEDMPEPGKIKGANQENSALVSAQRIITKMHEAAKNSDDPVAALTTIHTSRANPYLKAVDDEREKLLAHFGHKVDREATASKFEKDGHTVTIGKEGDQHKVHFAGVDPDKAKGQVTSIAGRRQVEETDTGKKDPKFITGRANLAYTAKGNKVQSKYSLVEASDLTTSHTIQGHINRAYPQEIQPRERERLSSQMQMANIMNDIRPEQLGHSANAADGAPIVGKDGAVESGNGRTIALSEAYKRGLADKYKTWLKGEAEHFGLKPEDVEGMQQPVLVRLRDENDSNTDRAEFAREANQSSNLGSSPAEQAWSDSERIDDTLLKKFQPDEDGEIYCDDNMDFINGFLDKLGKNESASLRDADGDPNKKAIERIQNAVFTKVYGSSVLTELQAESAKPKIRNVLRALNACVGDFAQVKGHDDLDVVPDMMEAIEYTLSHQGQSRAELEHTLRNAGSLNFTGDTPTFKTDYATDMILAIADRTGSRSRLENVFKGISHAIKTEVASRENPEVDMFSGPAEPKSKETVVKQALQQANSGADLNKAQSFQARAFTHLLLKHQGGQHGRERQGQKAVPAERGPAQAGAAGSRPAGRKSEQEGQGCQEAEGKGIRPGAGAAGREGTAGSRAGNARLIKARVRSYDRVTPHGALVHVMEHEDSRVRKYGQKLSFSQDSHEVRGLQRERFGHLPHWGKLDEATRLKVLDAEDIAADQHKRREEGTKGETTPMAEHLPGDRSGMLQMRMFKSIRTIPDRSLLIKSTAIANHPGYVLRTTAGPDGQPVRRWFRAGSAEAVRLGHAATGAFSPEEAMIDAMRQVAVPYFSDTSESNRMTARRSAHLRQLALIGNIDAIANLSTSRTRANYAAVDDYRAELLAAANAARNIAPPEETLAAAPAPTTITAGNMQNSALISAQNKINRLYEAAQEEDPVAAILAIQTTRSNGYTRAADDYRTLLLRHFGHNSDGTPQPASQSGEANSTPMPQAPVVQRETATPRSAPAPRTRRPSAPAAAQPPTNPVPGSANPLNLTEAQLGFVPRPDYPLTYYTGTDGYWNNRGQAGAMQPYRDTAQRDLARRYITQDAAMQNRARDYQAGTWVPDTPEARAQREAAERTAAVERDRAAREANERNRAALTNLQTKLVRSGFKAHGVPGANISGWGIDWPAIGAKAQNVMGLNSPDELKHALGTMLADYGGTTSFRVSVSSYDDRMIAVEMRGSDGTRIDRTFTKQSTGKVVVDHSYFQAGTSGGNSGKAFLRASMGVYKVIGATRVDVHANIDVGGDTWARFGFKATTANALQVIKNQVQRNLSFMQTSDKTVTAGGRRSTFRQFTPDQAAKVGDLLTSSNPESIWAIADMKHNGNDLGKALLLGTNWYGSLDITDDSTMRRFARYVN